MLIEDRSRAEARRRSWVLAYRTLGDAGAVCRRFGISRPTLRKWLGRYEREGEVGLAASLFNTWSRNLSVAWADRRRAKKATGKRLQSSIAVNW